MRPSDARAAVVFGSGLAVVPKGATVEREESYAALGWPGTSVPGHEGRLLFAQLGRAKVLLAWGRAHLYEGWSEAALRAQMDAFAAWGVRRVIVTNAAGALSAAIAAGTVVVADELVDLRSAPALAPPRIPATAPALAEPCVRALRPHVPCARGRYVAVPGPQYETPAEVAWLASYGDVVGMSTASEVEAGREHGQELAVLALVVNRAGAVASHDQVLATAAGLAGRLASVLPSLLAALWPAVFA